MCREDVTSRTIDSTGAPGTMNQINLLEIPIGEIKPGNRIIDLNQTLPGLFIRTTFI